MISLCMITKNEEKYLAQCLNSVKDLVSEIIIIDTGSTDKTKEIAKRYTKNVFDFKWTDDFSKARNFGIGKATKEWILVLDADEIIDGKSKDRIRELIKEKKVDGFAFEQLSYVDKPCADCLKNTSSFELGRKYSFLIKKNLVRLFRNRKGVHFRHRVHEVVEDSIREKKLAMAKAAVQLHHLGSVKGDEILNEKLEFYSNLILKQLADDPDSPRYNYYAARYYMGINDFEKALALLRKTATLDPRYKLVFSDIAKLYLQKNDMENAIKHFRKSWQLHKENPSPANNLAVLLMHRREFAEAKSILEEQMQRNPDNAALKINYQQLMKEIGQNRKYIAG